MLVQEKNRLKAPGDALIKSSCAKMIAVPEQEMKSLQEPVDQLIAHDRSLCQKKEVLKSIPGIGNITAASLLCLMPELGTMNRRQAASLAGLAPHPHQSGLKEGYRRVKGGKVEVRNALFLAAMTAARSFSVLGLFYRRLVQAGKKKMVALTALIRKLVVIANARLKPLVLSV